MSLVLTIDPGPEQSAYMLFDPQAVSHPLVSLEHGIVPNVALREKLRRSMVLEVATACVIEKIEHFGMPAGASLFQTCIWIGRFIEAWHADSFVLLPRREVKQHLCHSAKANDATIRQALLDLYGGEKAAIGVNNKKVRAPGPLYGISKDVWSCLALGVTHAAHQGGQCASCGWEKRATGTTVA